MSDPNWPHSVPYVVATVPGGATITLTVVGMVDVVGGVMDGIPYVLATILLLTDATVFTPPSNMKFLVPGMATHDRRFVSLEKSAYASE
jgi:hypothetical protein